MRRIVLDSNILFSALIRNSTTRKLILEYDGTFLFPAHIFNELRTHQNELLQKTQLLEEEFFFLLHALLAKFEIIENEQLDSVYTHAIEIAQTIDPNDVIFIACMLVHPDGILWSNDRRLKKQNYFCVMNTREIIKYWEMNSS